MASNNLAKLVFNEDTPREQYMELFGKPQGTIFKVERDYETVMRRMEEYRPIKGRFVVFPINPGTHQYTLVGPDHLVITINTLVMD